MKYIFTSYLAYYNNRYEIIDMKLTKTEWLKLNLLNLTHLTWNNCFDNEHILLLN
jgi:hypothetical protein